MNTSAQNQNIVFAKKLLQKKYRDSEGKYLIEGAKLVREALERGLKIDYIIVSNSCENKFYALLCETKYFTVEDNVFKTLTDTVSNQGILAVLTKPKLKLRPPKSNALILEHIQDPANVGAILRTAAASGYNDVYLIECADPYSPKCIRSGMSSQFCLNIFSATKEEVLANLKDTCLLVCADMDGENAFSCEITQLHALVLGNEGNGVSEELKSACQKTVSIPMANGMESLNVSVTAGILMYLISNKNKN